MLIELRKSRQQGKSRLQCHNICEGVHYDWEELAEMDAENEEMEQYNRITNLVASLKGMESDAIRDVAGEMSVNTAGTYAVLHRKYVVVLEVGGWDEMEGSHYFVFDNPRDAKRNARHIEKDLKKSLGKGNAGYLCTMCIVGPDGNVMDGEGIYDYFDPVDDYPDMYHAYGDCRMQISLKTITFRKSR